MGITSLILTRFKWFKGCWAPYTFWKSVPHQVCVPIRNLHCVAHKVKWRCPCWHPPLEPLRWLLIGKETDAKDFRQHICSYNSALAFTSVGANLDTSVAQPGNYTYHIHGELYHRMKSLLPQPGEARKFVICRHPSHHSSPHPSRWRPPVLAFPWWVNNILWVGERFFMEHFFLYLIVA
jgi:hypothetical protein